MTVGTPTARAFWMIQLMLQDLREGNLAEAWLWDEADSFLLECREAAERAFNEHP